MKRHSILILIKTLFLIFLSNEALALVYCNTGGGPEYHTGAEGLNCPKQPPGFWTKIKRCERTNGRGFAGRSNSKGEMKKSYRKRLWKKNLPMVHPYKACLKLYFQLTGTRSKDYGPGLSILGKVIDEELDGVSSQQASAAKSRPFETKASKKRKAKRRQLAVRQSVSQQTTRTRRQSTNAEVAPRTAPTPTQKPAPKPEELRDFKLYTAKNQQDAKYSTQSKVEASIKGVQKKCALDGNLIGRLNDSHPNRTYDPNTFAPYCVDCNDKYLWGIDYTYRDDLTNQIRKNHQKISFAQNLDYLFDSGPNGEIGFGLFTLKNETDKENENRLFFSDPVSEQRLGALPLSKMFGCMKNTIDRDFMNVGSHVIENGVAQRMSHQ